MYTAERLFKYGETAQYVPIRELVNRYMESWLDHHSRDAKLILHHYTDARGLHGIISSRELWCTEIKFLNDSKEFEYGTNRIKEAIDVLSIAYEDKPVIQESFLGRLKTVITSFASVQYHIFVACFCEEADLLSQWRGYADHGGGYSMGVEFDDDCFVRAASGKPIKPLLRKILYDSEEQQHLVRDFLDQACDICSQAPRRSGETDFEYEAWLSSIALYISNVLIDWAVSFKHPGFQEEREWRLIRILRRDDEVHDECRFRASQGYPLPYVVTRLHRQREETESEFPLRQVGYGPTLDADRAELAIRLLLDSQAEKTPVIDVDGVDIIEPNVPYRGY